MDINPPADIKADAKDVGDTMLCTCITNQDGHSIHTVEHLASALSGLGIEILLLKLTAMSYPFLTAALARLFSCCKAQALLS